MKHKVLFLQLEIFLDCAPHMGMCLFINELRRDGLDVTTYLVNCNYLDDLLAFIQKENFDLICLDSSFTVDMVNAIMAQRPEIPILVGGVNALALFLHTRIPFAVFGPGREAAREFMDEFFGSKNFENVTNLFFKIEDRIHYSGKTNPWDLPSEILPYDPCLSWQYMGPERKRGANTEAVSIVAGTGCPHSKTVRSTIYYDIRQAVHALGHEATDNALQRLDEIFNRKTHGCSFCVFQLQEFTVYSVSKTTELLLQQSRHLSKKFDTRAFCIQTENPFPFLNPFLHRLVAEKIPVDFVSIRTRPDILIKQQEKLQQALDTAYENDFHISIEEIGFETFVEEELVLFNKGVTVETNLEALNLLRHIKDTFGNTVSVHVGHGIILFHPWTTLDSMVATLEVMDRYPEVFPRFYPNRLTLYSEFLPLFHRVSGEGLARKTDDSGYGWDFTSMNTIAEKAFELYSVLYAILGPDMSISQYTKAIGSLEHNSLEQVLEREYGLVPDDE